MWSFASPFNFLRKKHFPRSPFALVPVSGTTSILFTDLEMVRIESEDSRLRPVFKERQVEGDHFGRVVLATSGRVRERSRG